MITVEFQEMMLFNENSDLVVNYFVLTKVDNNLVNSAKFENKNEAWEFFRNENKGA